MKLGTENKKALIAAVVLVPLAVVLFVRMLSGTSDVPAAPSPAPTPTTAQSQPAPATAQATPDARRAERVRDPRQRRIGVVLPPTLDPRLRLDLLKNSEQLEYAGRGRNIFESTSEPEIPKPVAGARTEKKPPEQVYVPPGPPPPPPIDLKFYGWASKPGEPRRIFLSQRGDVFVAGEGDVIAQRYRIVRINPNSVEVEDLLSNNRQTIPLTQG